jgi:RES domain-containing protein
LTPEDRELDPAFFLNHQPLTLFRLARARYANLSGVGAAVAPGRWNRLGEDAIYTSTEAGVPLLERLVHTPKNLIPSNLALMTLRISGNWVADDNHLIDLRTEGHIWICRSLAEAKETIPRVLFALGREIFAVAVPSVIVPVWNVVLYPQGKGFWEHVSLESLEPFAFDPRLFPDNTPVETADFNV